MAYTRAPDLTHLADDRPQRGFDLLRDEAVAEEHDRLRAGDPRQAGGQPVDRGDRLERRPLDLDRELGPFCLTAESAIWHWSGSSLQARVVARCIAPVAACDAQRFFLVEEARPLPGELDEPRHRVVARFDLLQGVQQFLPHAGEPVVDHLVAGEDAGDVAVLEPVADELPDRLARARSRSPGSDGSGRSERSTSAARPRRRRGAGLGSDRGLTPLAPGSDPGLTPYS